MVSIVANNPIIRRTQITFLEFSELLEISEKSGLLEKHLDYADTFEENCSFAERIFKNSHLKILQRLCFQFAFHHLKDVQY